MRIDRGPVPDFVVLACSFPCKGLPDFWIIGFALPGSRSSEVRQGRKVWSAAPECA